VKLAGEAENRTEHKLTNARSRLKVIDGMGEIPAKETKGF